MSRKNNFIVSLIILFFLLMSSCNIFAQPIVPYEIKASFVCEKNSASYKIGGLDCKFYNSSSKEVEKFVLVFSLFDKDGIPAINQIMFEIDAKVKTNEFISFILNLDELLKKVDVTISDVDFVYVSKIIYSDGSEWSDPFGIKYSL